MLPDNPARRRRWVLQRRARGYLLLAVSASLVVLSVFALSALEIGRGEADLRAQDAQRSELRLAARAGLAHMQWALRQGGSCAGYQQLADTDFAGHRYRAKTEPQSGSPVSIASVAQDAAGESVTLRMDDVPVLRSPETLVLQPGDFVDDTSVDGNDTDKNRGNTRNFRVGSFSPNYGLMRFDLSALPSNVTVLSAELELNYTDNADISVGASIGIYPMRQAWRETEATFDEADKNVSWTWPDAFDGDTLIDSLAMHGLALGPVRFDLTRLVRAWSAKTIPNHGFALVGLGGVNNARFATGDENDVSKQPVLRITYACECGVVCELSPDAPDVLLFVKDEGSPEKEDEDRAELLESWGWRVTYVDDDEKSNDIEAAAAVADAAYVSSTVDASKLFGELEALPIGVVSEQSELLIEMGFATQFSEHSLQGIDISSVPHYITEEFAPGAFVQLTDVDETFHGLRGSLSVDAMLLAAIPDVTANPNLSVLDAGALRQDGSLSIARRVNLPWAGRDNSFDPRRLTDEGRLVLRRALEWAAASPVSVGDYRDTLKLRTCVADVDYHGSDGELDWSANAWQELLDDDLPCAGDAQVVQDLDAGNAESFQLHITSGGVGFERQVDLSGFSDATLSYSVRVKDFILFLDSLIVSASSDGTTYSPVDALSLFGSTNNYSQRSIDLSDYAGAPVWLRFNGVFTTGDAEVYLDNFVVEEN